MTHSRILAAIQSEIWAITEPALQQIIAIAEHPEHDIQALEARIGNKLPKTEAVVMRDGVAVLSLSGPIFRYANMFTMVSGANSVQTAAIDFNAALANKDVKAILINIGGGPGGMAAGIAEFAQQIRAANNIKPVWVYVESMAASAHYWLATAGGRLVAGKTAELGNLGAVFDIPKRSGDDTISIVSAQTPFKRADPNTEAGAAIYSERATKLAEVFIQDAANYRGVSVDKALEDFGKGKLLIASDALAAGMIDEVSIFEDTLAALQAYTKKPNKTKPLKSAGAKNVDLETLKTEHPETYALALAEGQALGAAAAAESERERIKAIEALAMPGHESLIASMKYDPSATAATVALAVVAAEKTQREAQQAALKNHTPLPLEASAPPFSGGGADASPPKTDAEKWSNEWGASAELQAEFPDASIYVTYKQGVKDGRIK